MVQIQIDISDEEINRQLELFKAARSLATKSIAVEEVIREYFKKNKIDTKM